METKNRAEEDQQPEIGSRPRRQIALVAGSNRTGTSLLAEILTRQGFRPPDAICDEYLDYTTHESKTFKEISRRWNSRKAREFVESFSEAGDKILLKYPKASYVLKRWIQLIPDARVIYVYRPREESVASRLANRWNGRPLTGIVRWIYRWEWTRGFLAMSNLPIPVCFVTFDELKLNQDFTPPASFGWGDANHVRSTSPSEDR